MNVRQRFSEARSRNRGCLGAVLAVGLFLVVLVAVAFLVGSSPRATSAAQIDVFATLTAMAPANTSNCPQGQVEVKYDGSYPVDFGCQDFAIATQVAVAQAELNGGVVLPTPTPANVTINGSEFSWQQLAALGTPMPGGTNDGPEANAQAFANGMISLSGFPAESTPVRWGNNVIQPNVNPVDTMAWIVADPGTISADDIADCGQNKSCVWTGGANVDNLVENQTATYTCPEGGYTKLTTGQATISTNGTTIALAAAAGVNYTVLTQCLFDEGPEDNSLVMEFHTDQPGRLKVMRYPVPPEFGGYFSFVHLVEDLDNGMGTSDQHDLDGADNCGAQGCTASYLVLVSQPHRTVEIYKYLGNNQFERIHSNVVRPTPAQ